MLFSWLGERLIGKQEGRRGAERGRRTERTEGRLEMAPQTIEKARFGNENGVARGGMNPGEKAHRGSSGAGGRSKTVSMSRSQTVEIK
jgi:hypothetical protein